MKQLKTLPALSGMTLVMIGLSAVAFAPSGGRVMAVTGSANILRDNSSLAAEKGSVIQQGDLLTTPVDGRLQWWMEDDSLIAMASTSEVHVRHFEPSAGDVVYTLSDGAMRIISGNTEPTVLTALAKVSALGTDFSTFLCTATTCRRSGPHPGNRGHQPGKGRNDAPVAGDVNLYVRVDRGRVRVQNSAGAVVASQEQVVYVESSLTAPVIIREAPRILVQAYAELQFDPGIDDFIPGVPVQPLPPVELPGSPS